jgi:hypothetical protein
MRHLICALGLCLAISSAKAGELSFQVTNHGEAAVTGINATSPEASEPIPIENSQVGPGESSEVTFTAPGDFCVYDLTIKATNREDIQRPDVDLCQLETLIIE